MVRRGNKNTVRNANVAATEEVVQGVKDSRNAAAPAASASFGDDTINAAWTSLTSAADAAAHAAAASQLSAALKTQKAGVVGAVVAAMDFSQKGPARLGALFLVEALAKELGLVAEPYVLETIPHLLDLASSKVKPEAVQAVAALNAVASSMSKHSLDYVLPMLFAGIASEKNWQTRVAAFNVIEARVDAAPVELAAQLPVIVPELTGHLWDTKAQVKAACRAAMSKALATVDNPDIAGVVEPLMSAMINPSEVVEFTHKVAATTFVRSVTSPTLAILVPTLLRALNERQTAVKRQAAKIIHNMSKLVDNPKDAAPFLPLLMPALEKTTESVSNPEARAVCTAAYEQLVSLDTKVKAKEAVPTSVEHSVLVGLLKVDGAEAAQLDLAARLAASIIKMQNFDAELWTQNVAPVLALWVRRLRPRRSVLLLVR
jgi:elongation factor 3